MSTSAVNSYHMVSELRLLISLNQDGPMGEEGLFDPNLPPVFDVYDDGLVMNQMVPLHYLNESDAYEDRGINSETVNLFGPVHYSDIGMISLNPCHDTVPSLDSGGDPFGQQISIRDCGNFVYSTATVYQGMQICVWNQQQMSKVFDPGTL